VLLRRTGRVDLQMLALYINVNNVNVNNVNNKFIERTGTSVSSALGCHLQYCVNRNVFNWRLKLSIESSGSRRYSGKLHQGITPMENPTGFPRWTVKLYNKLIVHVGLYHWHGSTWMESKDTVSVLKACVHSHWTADVLHRQQLLLPPTDSSRWRRHAADVASAADR